MGHLLIHMMIKKYSIDDIIYINIGFALEEAEFAEIKNKMKKRIEAKKLAKAQKRGIEGKTDEEVSFTFITSSIVTILGSSY